MERIIRIGTRGSRLARWQANYLATELAKIGQQTEIIIIKTKGDQIQHLGFDKIEGKGFFTKEIEEALLAETVDLAVHSMKDLPTSGPEGLAVTAVSYRENPADWLLARREVVQTGALFGLPEGATVGTSSTRRKAQLLDFRADLELRDIRGNVPTRIEKLRGGEFDAIMLAGAGLTRLELAVDDLHVVRFSPREFVPAPAQGVLAFQTRSDDRELRRTMKRLHRPEVAACTNVERKVLQLLGGGCHMPLGVYCERDDSGNYHLWAALAERWNAPLRRAHLSSATSYELAEQLLEQLQPST